MPKVSTKKSSNRNKSFSDKDAEDALRAECGRLVRNGIPLEDSEFKRALYDKVCLIDHDLQRRFVESRVLLRAVAKMGKRRDPKPEPTMRAG